MKTPHEIHDELLKSCGPDATSMIFNSASWLSIIGMVKTSSLPDLQKQNIVEGMVKTLEHTMALYCKAEEMEPEIFESIVTSVLIMLSVQSDDTRH